MKRPKDDAWLKDRASRSAGLLISILTRYPELASVRFETRTRALRFTFLVSGHLDRASMHRVRERVTTSLEALCALEGKLPQAFWIGRSTYGHLTAFEIVRDLNTLSQEEISLLIELVKDEFHGTLVRDDVAYPSPDDELAEQEEIIGEMLEDLKGSRQDRNLIAVREEGRVFVYNK